MEHRSKTRLMSAAVIAAVFGAGVLIGYAADTRLEAEPTPVATPAATPDEGGERPSRTPLYARLNPTDAQQAVIDSIISVHRSRTNALDQETRRAYRQGFREILLQTRAAIKEVFPPEKAREYQRLLDEWDAEQAADRENRDSRK